MEKDVVMVLDGVNLNVLFRFQRTKCCVIPVRPRKRSLRFEWVQLLMEL